MMSFFRQQFSLTSGRVLLHVSCAGLSLAFFVVVTSGVVPLVHAQIADFPCHIFSKDRAVPERYGASYNVFTAAKELILNPLCQSPGHLLINMEGPTGTTYISKIGYIWNGDAWEPITYRGNTPAPGVQVDPVTGIADWYVGQASLLIERDARADYPDTIYFVAQTCTFVNNTWKCGCKDAACADSLWQIQAVYNSRTVGVGVTTGDPTTTGSPTTGTTGEPRPIIGTEGGPFAGTSGDINDFERLTGRPVRIVNGYMGASSWNAIEGNTSFFTTAKNRLVQKPTYRQMISMALVSSESSRQGSGLAQCAAGAFNGHWVQFAQSMRTKGLDKLILRLGWEFNLGNWPWATNMSLAKAAEYRECWKQVVGTINSTFPENDFIYEWNVNSGPYEGNMNRAFLDAAYPGAGYVDIIGLDMYDTWFSSACNNGTDVICKWDSRNKRTLENITVYAAEKGKPIGVSEWGVWDDFPGTGDTRGGEDNPYFVQKFCEWAKNPASHVAYYVYFDEMVEQPPMHNHLLTSNPRAAAAFNQYCEANLGSAADGL